MPQELTQYCGGARDARDPVLAALGTLVGDPALRRRLAAVRDPWLAPPALVHVSVRVDEARERKKTATVDDLLLIYRRPTSSLCDLRDHTIGDR
ncbi:hypothetical protein OG809_41220 [Kribbella soli]